MKYVLIFVVVTKVFGSYSVTAEFDTKAACEVVNDSLRALQRLTSKSEPHNAYLHGECYPK